MGKLHCTCLRRHPYYETWWWLHHAVQSLHLYKVGRGINQKIRSKILFHKIFTWRRLNAITGHIFTFYLFVKRLKNLLFCFFHLKTIHNMHYIQFKLELSFWLGHKKKWNTLRGMSTFARHSKWFRGNRFTTFICLFLWLQGHTGASLLCSPPLFLNAPLVLISFSAPEPRQLHNYNSLLLSSLHPQLNDYVRNKEHLSYLLPPLCCVCPCRRHAENR